MDVRSASQSTAYATQPSHPAFQTSQESRTKIPPRFSEIPQSPPLRPTSSRPKPLPILDVERARDPVEAVRPVRVRTDTGQVQHKRVVNDSRFAPRRKPRRNPGLFFGTCVGLLSLIVLLIYTANLNGYINQMLSTGTSSEVQEVAFRAALIPTDALIAPGVAWRSGRMLLIFLSLGITLGGLAWYVCLPGLGLIASAFYLLAFLEKPAYWLAIIPAMLWTANATIQVIRVRRARRR